MGVNLRAAAAAWKLGWKIESNWTRTWIYFIYHAARPLALCLIIYFIFKLRTQNPGADPGFAAVFLSNALFTIFITVSSGISWVIIEDRDHYQLIRYLAISPMKYLAYIAGRTALFSALAILSTLIILAVGYLWLGIPLPLNPHYLAALASLLLGVIGTAAMGIIQAGFVLITARHAFILAEGSAGIFLLLCGVLYPPDMLPAWIRVFALPLPMTWWMESARRSMDMRGFSASLSGFSDSRILALQLFLTVVFAIAAFLIFNRLESRARATGKIDQTTNY